MSDQFSTQPHQEKVKKPWGEETIYAPSGLPYAGKILFIKGGKKISFQYHTEKQETLCMFSGNAIIWLENAKGEIEKISMEPFHGYTVKPGQKHRIETIEDSYILEASTPETGDTFRIEDDYNRPTETEEMRKEKNRGWDGQD